jgi:hypothetical protein
MQAHARLFASLLFTAFFLLSGFALAEAQEQSSAVNGGLWSDPGTWADRELPGEGDRVTIGEDVEVVLDVSPPPLDGIRLNGKLSFADDEDPELTTDHGSFVIFEFPEFTTPSGGAEQSSLDALKGASETSYFRDDESLWVKLVAADAGEAVPDGPGGPGAGGPGAGNRIDVSR